LDHLIPLVATISRDIKSNAFTHVAHAAVVSRGSGTNFSWTKKIDVGSLKSPVD
jgi:hypothetical protein